MNTTEAKTKSKTSSKKSQHPLFRIQQLAKLPIDGIWMMTLTNYPKLYLKEMRGKFEGCLTAETYIRVNSFETGYSAVKTIYKIIDANAFYQDDERSVDKSQPIYLAIHVYMGMPEPRKYTSYEIVDMVKQKYNESKLTIFPKDAIVPSRPVLELQLVNDPNVYFDEMGGKFRAYAPILEHSYLADSMATGVKAINEISDIYKDLANVKSVNDSFDPNLPVFLAVHIYIKKPLSRSKLVTDMLLSIKANYSQAVKSSFVNKAMSSSDEFVNGLWIVCLTNHPKTFFKNVNDRYHFMSTYESIFDIDTLEDGILSTTEFIIKFGGHPQFDSFQADLDVKKKMYLAVVILC